MHRGHYPRHVHHIDHRAPDAAAEPLPLPLEALGKGTVFQNGADLSRRNPTPPHADGSSGSSDSGSSGSSSSSTASTTSSSTSSTSGDKPVSSTLNLKIPIALGVTIPLLTAIIIFLILHRRHKKRLRLEETNDPHRSLDFGMDGSGEPKGKKGKSTKGAPEMTITQVETEKNIRRGRGMSMDMGSPFLLPPEVHNSRESLHSLSRTQYSNGDDRYRPATTFIPNDGSSHRSYQGTLKAHDDSSIYTGSSASKDGMSQDLMKHAQRMSRSSPPQGRNFIPNSRTQSPELSHNAHLKGSPAGPHGRGLMPSVEEPRDSYIDKDSGGMRKSNNYLRAFIHSRDPSADLLNQQQPTTAKQLPQELVAAPAPTLQQAERQKSPPPALAPSSPGSRPPRLQSMQAPIHSASELSFVDDASDYGDIVKFTPPSPSRSAEPQNAQGERYSIDTPMPTVEEYAADGLGAPGLGYDPRRLSMGFRPLPPEDPTDNPEQRANRIRSFYKEYFDETKPGPSKGYYEDYDQGYAADGAALFDPASGDFVTARAPFAQPVTRRAMTPPPRGPPQFQGRPRNLSTMSGGRYVPPGPRAFSTTSGGRGPARKPLPPPAPLRVLPSPHLLKEDSFALPIDFAPPTNYRDRQAGRPQSPLGGSRPFSPGVRAHTPLNSSFDDLSVMPSPHLLRKSGTFTALDFAPPPRFGHSQPGSDAGSIRSGRSAMSAAQLNHIRAGAYRLSRIPKGVVGTKEDLANTLKPTWGPSGMRS
ncbi:MAG: hypothetical protein M1835_001928 [Candelina submexicana]|nr:MAG: hypothetical protein M1835_001928 [Candelina submexicana]